MAGTKRKGVGNPEGMPKGRHPQTGKRAEGIKIFAHTLPPLEEGIPVRRRNSKHEFPNPS